MADKSKQVDVEQSPKQKGTVRRSFSWAFKPFVNVFAWVGLDFIKDSTRGIFNRGRELFIPQPKKATEETFDDVVKRLQLSTTDLAEKGRNFMRLALVYAAIAIALYIYSLYLAFTGTLNGFLLGLVLGTLALVFAFRYHFWWFQIKHRKLGCTFKEWFNSVTEEEKKS